LDEAISTTIEVIYSREMAPFILFRDYRARADAGFLDDVYVNSVALTSDANESVGLLQERPLRPISAAVTGKPRRTRLAATGQRANS